MTNDGALTLYYTPFSRAVAAAVLLEAAGATYETKRMDLKSGDQHSAAFRTINPMAKVPVLVHGKAVVTELVAICLYVADLYPAAKLAPATDDPDRGPYLRWMLFYAGCVEPAVTDRILGRQGAPYSVLPYGSFEATWEAVTAQLATGPWLLGHRFTAADVVWGCALAALSHMGALPEISPAIGAYIARVQELPAVAKVRDRDLALGPPPA